MKRYLELVPIAAKVHHKQSKMTRICIILAVFLVAVMFGLADMYLQGLIQKEIQTNGNWHYQFTSIDTDTATHISEHSKVKAAGWHNLIPTDAGYTFFGQAIAFSAQEKSTFEQIYLNKMIEGKYPETSQEIAVSTALKDNYHLSLNDTFPVTQPDKPTVSYTIVGFLEDANTPRLAAGEEPIAVLTTEGLAALSSSASQALTEPKFVIQLSLLCNMPDTIEDLKVSYHLQEEQVTANENLLSIVGQMSGSNVNQIYQIAFLLSLIVMLTCVLMISSSLNSNVLQRTEFFGMIRCLGATRKQVMRIVQKEGLHWCKTSIPIGIVLSVVVVWILSAAMRMISPQWFSYMPPLGISWISIAVSILLGLLTVLLAARSPAKKAAKVSPLEAVSGNTQQTASFRKTANTRLFQIETALGIHHAKAGKKNYILMTGAFAVCIALFLTFSTLVDFMQNAMMPSEWTPHLSISSEDNTCSIKQELLEKVNQQDAVKRAYGRMFAYGVTAQIQGITQKANVISYEENQFRWAEDSLMEGSIDTVKQQSDQVLIVKSESSPVKVGDTITLNVNEEEHIVTVAGILSDSPFAREAGTETIFCSEKTFTGLTGQTDYTIIDIQFKNNAGEEDVSTVESIFTDGVIFTNKFTEVQKQKNLYQAFSVLVYGFLSIIVAITVFHIMNIINMGVAAKMKQYGAMRAIGMSNRQLVKMIIAEAATYALSGVIAGCIIGIPMHWVIYVSLITTFWGIAWSIPLMPLGFIVSIILITTIFAVRGPAKRLYDMSIVDNITAQ